MTNPVARYLYCPSRCHWNTVQHAGSMLIDFTWFCLTNGKTQIGSTTGRTLFYISESTIKYMDGKGRLLKEKQTKLHTMVAPTYTHHRDYYSTTCTSSEATGPIRWWKLRKCALPRNRVCMLEHTHVIECQFLKGAPSNVRISNHGTRRKAATAANLLAPLACWKGLFLTNWHRTVVWYSFFQLHIEMYTSQSFLVVKTLTFSSKLPPQFQ